MTIASDLKDFINSSFVSAFLSALAGASFGTWGAQRFAQRNSRINELTNGLRQANAAVVLAATFTKQTLSLKHQLVAPLLEKYLADRSKVAAAFDALHNGQKAEPPNVQAELKKISAPILPIDALKNLTLNGGLTPGRALALACMVEQSITQLTESINLRSSWIDQIKPTDIGNQKFAADFYGITMKGGSANCMYHDLMIAISEYTDELAFFSATLAEDMQQTAKYLSDEICKMGHKKPFANEVDFSKEKASGLLPTKENFEGWLAGFDLRN